MEAHCRKLGQEKTAELWGGRGISRVYERSLSLLLLLVEVLTGKRFRARLSFGRNENAVADQQAGVLKARNAACSPKQPPAKRPAVCGVGVASCAMCVYVSCLVLSINLIHCGNEFRNSVPVRTLGL